MCVKVAIAVPGATVPLIQRALSRVEERFIQLLVSRIHPHIFAFSNPNPPNTGEIYPHL